MSAPMRDQRIRDPIHNLIKFSSSRSDDRVLWQLVQTREFQRLRRIRQLGFSELVFPGATHTRFSHALGAMQTARNMLAVFLRNKVVGADADHELLQTATLCAALLHDIGHGPFSHVFEEVSKKCGIQIHHEEWTRKIIAEGSVSDTLKMVSDELRNRTLFFFEKEPGYNLYSTIVSSQLDADRLDFLLRDRYFTGIHFGVIDPEWIFDCLRIEELNIDLEGDAKQFCFVVLSKGQSAIENYLYAYSQLYSNVYFHKTTRAAQVMLQDILLGIIKTDAVREKLPAKDPVRHYFEAGPNPSLDDYLALDDFALWNVVTWAAENDFQDVSSLAKRLIRRDLYKCFMPPHTANVPVNPVQVGDFAGKLKKQDIWFYRDTTPEKGYKTFSGEGMVYLKNILVFNERDKKPCSISSMSRLVEHMPDLPSTRFYFRTSADRDIAATLWQ